MKLAHILMYLYIWMYIIKTEFFQSQYVHVDMHIYIYIYKNTFKSQLLIYFIYGALRSRLIFENLHRSLLLRYRFGSILNQNRKLAHILMYMYI